VLKQLYADNFFRNILNVRSFLQRPLYALQRMSNEHYFILLPQFN